MPRARFTWDGTDLLCAVLVHSPDRLSRRYAHQVLLIEELDRHGVEAVFLMAQSMKSPVDHLLVLFHGIIAEYHFDWRPVEPRPCYDFGGNVACDAHPEANLPLFDLECAGERVGGEVHLVSNDSEAMCLEHAQPIRDQSARRA